MTFPWGTADSFWNALHIFVIHEYYFNIQISHYLYVILLNVVFMHLFNPCIALDVQIS